MDISQIISRGINVLLSPRKVFNEVKSEQINMQQIVIYLGIMALPGLIGYIIGYGVVGVPLVFFTYKFSMGYAIGFGVFYYIMSIVGIIVFGYVINFLAPNFKSKQNLMQSMKLVAFSATPALVAGFFNIYPPLALLIFLAALYGLYMLYIGIPIFMETPKDQQIIYLIISIVAYVVIIFVLNWIVSSIMWASVGGYPITSATSWLT